MAMSLADIKFQQEYNIAVVKKAMNTQETAAQAIMEMLPQQMPPVAEGHIDVYA